VSLPYPFPVPSLPPRNPKGREYRIGHGAGRERITPVSCTGTGGGRGKGLVCLWGANKQ